MKSFFILLFLFPLLSYAQKEDRVWVFQDSICIDFNNLLSPSVSKIDINNLNADGENSSSIASSNGNLLFYVDVSDSWSYPGAVSKIRGNNTQIIANGDSLSTHSSMTHGLIFLPSKLDTTKYYFFYVANSFFQPVSNGFYYGVINKTSNNGFCLFKDSILSNGLFSEKLNAVRHGNGQDWWIIIHKDSSKEFYKYLLTDNDLLGPYIQLIGPNLINLSVGQMKFSPDGSKLGLVDINNRVALFDFNRCTGLISNYKNLGNEPNAYGCSFSPDNKIFYMSTFRKLYQFNLDSPNVAQTKQLIWYDSLISTNFQIGQHLLGPDGKIYITRCYASFPNSVFDTANMNLTVINNPDVYGSGCNVQPYSFYLGGMRCFYGLPNMVNYNLGPLIGSPCDTILNCVAIQNNFSESICGGDVFDFNGTPLTTTGTYHDTLMNVGGCDSLVTLQLSVLNTTSSNTSASICSGDSYSFNGNQLTASGNYFDTLVNVQGCDSLITLQLSVLNNSAFSSSQKICAGDTLHIGNHAHSIAGIFIDTLLNTTGCDSIVTTLLTVDSVIVSISSIADTLTATASGVGITYQWINCDSSTIISGATNQNLVATETGNYAVIVTDGNNCSKQSECLYVMVLSVNSELSNVNGFSIYPNPTDGEITVVLREVQHDSYTITLSDALGRIIINDKTNLNSKILNLKSIPSGVYFVKVVMSDGSFGVKKFVKE